MNILLPLLEIDSELPLPKEAMEKVVLWGILFFVATGVVIGTVAFWIWAYRKLSGNAKGVSLEVAEDEEAGAADGKKKSKDEISVGRVFAAYEEQHKRTISWMESQHQERIAAMEKQFSERLDEMERSHNSRIAAMEVTHADRVKVLESIISGGKRELETLRSEKDKEINAQRQRCHDLVNKTQELATELSVLETKIEIAKKQAIPDGLTLGEVTHIFESDESAGTAFGQILEKMVEKNLSKLQPGK